MTPAVPFSYRMSLCASARARNRGATRVDFRFRWLLASVTLLCCAQPKTRADTLSTAEAASSPAPVAAKDAPAVPRPTCADPHSATLPHLQSVVAIKPHDVFWVKVLATAQEWTLAEPVALPYHHALRLEFSNQSEFPAFPEKPEQTLRVSFEVTAQDIRQVPGRRQWRNTISARLLEVCPYAD